MAAVCVSAAVLTGCQAQVGTDVAVTSSSTAQITVSARFSGEAGQVLLHDTSARTQLVDLFRARTGHRPAVRQGSDWLEASVTVPYDKLASLSEVTGTQGVYLSGGGTRVRVDFVPATKLTTAVAEQNASQPDADALTRTMLENTDLQVSVSFPGGATTATLTDSGGQRLDARQAARVGQLSVSDGKAVFHRTATSKATGQLVVVGDPSTPFPWLLVGGGSVMVAGAGGALWMRRRR